MHHFDARVARIDFKIGSVIPTKPESHPIFKMIRQLDPRAKFNWSAQIHACAAGIQPRHRMQLHIDTVNRRVDGIGMAGPCPSITRIANRQALYVLKWTMCDLCVAANVNLGPERIIVERGFANGISGKACNLAFL